MRVLIDRLMLRLPNSEKEARFDEWLKDAAPSQDLMNWFADSAERWVEFRERYWKELDAKPELIDQLHMLGSEQEVTLLYAHGTREKNAALCLLDYLHRHTTQNRVQANEDNL